MGQGSDENRATGGADAARRRRLVRIATLGLATFGVVLAGLLAWVFADFGVTEVGDARGFVGSETCGTCHTINHPGWQLTLHARMVQPATPATVRGDFEFRNTYWLQHHVESNRRPEGDRPLVRMVRSGDEYYAYIFDPESGEMNPYRITHVVGNEFRQTYLVESDGAFFRVPIQWSVPQERWVNLWNRQQHKHETPDGPMLAFLNQNGRWDQYCARCHTTGYRRSEGDEGGQRVEWAELGIACEACHGAGAKHVALFRDSKRQRLRTAISLRLGLDPASHIVLPSRLDPARTVSICGQCHQADIWLATIPEFVGYEPGEDLSEHFYEIPLEPACQEPPSNKTWADTSPRGPGLLFRSFVESRCFKEGGVTCIDCHAPHKPDEYRPLLEAGASSDAFCMGCHDGIAQAVEAHTRHTAGRPGSHCYDCHMPRLLEGLTMVGEYGYGRVRSHEIDHIPFPESSARFGTDAVPHACEECHRDHSAAWAAQWSQRWWGPRERIRAELEARIEAHRSAEAPARSHGL